MNKSEMYKNARIYELKGNMEKAYKCYLEAVLDYDDGEALKALADMYYSGDYVHEDYDKAGRYYGMAYDRGANIEPWTLIIAGSYWESRSNGNDEEIAQAISYYTSAVILGIEYGYECLGKVYFNLGEYDKAYENLQNISEENPCGLYYLGRLYDEGLGVKQDIDKAIDLYKQTIEIDRKIKLGNIIYDEDCRKAMARLKELNAI